MDKCKISHFRVILNKTIKQLESYCKDWEAVCIHTDVPENVLGEIRTTIGLTNLLISEKMKQFSGLIDEAANKCGEKEIRFLDLQGFWDMVYQEVIKLEKKFTELEKCKSNEWKFVQYEAKKQEPKKKLAIPAVPKQPTTKSDSWIAARQRLAEAKLRMKAQLAAQKKDGFTIEVMGFTRGALNSQDNSGNERKECNDKLRVLSDLEPTCNSNIKATEKHVEVSTKQFKTEEKENLRLIKLSKKGAISEEGPTEENIEEQMLLGKASAPKSKEKLLSATKQQKKKPLATSNSLSAPKSRVQSKSPALGRKRGKSKDFIPLQCITRSSTKKVLLAQQNS